MDLLTPIFPEIIEKNIYLMISGVIEVKYFF